MEIEIEKYEKVKEILNFPLDMNEYFIIETIYNKKYDIIEKLYFAENTIKLLIGLGFIIKNNENDKKYIVNPILNTIFAEDKESFSQFWEEYHAVTLLPKTDKEATIKHWKKLTKKEKNSAIENINRYYNSVYEKKYLCKARTYLANKRFNDEFFEDIKPHKQIENDQIDIR